MKVYYISNTFDGCWYVRNYLPMYHNGWDGDKLSIYGKRIVGDQMVKGAMNADVVVFQRPNDRERLEAAKVLQKAGKKIVFDNDDTYKLNSGVPTQMTTIYGKEKLTEMNDTLMEFIKIADLVTTTTETLRQEYNAYNKNVVVLPNMVDPDDFPVKKVNHTDKVRVGLVGSVVSNEEYEALKTNLDRLLKSPDVQVVIFGMPPKTEETFLTQRIYKKEYDFWLSKNIEWQPFVPFQDYFETLNNLTLDLMLIPRQNSYFNQAKSNIKFLEAAMLEIPVIASSFPNGPYEELDGKIGIKTKDFKEVWEVINKPYDLRWMGKAAKNYALKNYNIHNNYHLWETAYLTMWKE